MRQAQSEFIFRPILYAGWAKNRATLFYVVTLEMLIISAPNLAQINDSLFLILNCNLFESTVKKIKWRSLANGYNPDNILSVFSRWSCFTMRQTDDREIPVSLLIWYVSSTFMTADELLHKFDVFRNSDVRTDRGRPLHFGRCVIPVELIFSSSRSTQSGNSINKRREPQFFS